MHRLATLLLLLLLAPATCGLVIESDAANRAWIQRLRDLFAEVGSDAHAKMGTEEAGADG